MKMWMMAGVTAVVILVLTVAVFAQQPLPAPNYGQPPGLIECRDGVCIVREGSVEAVRAAIKKVNCPCGPGCRCTTASNCGCLPARVVRPAASTMASLTGKQQIGTLYGLPVFADVGAVAMSPGNLVPGPLEPGTNYPRVIYTTPTTRVAVSAPVLPRPVFPTTASSVCRTCRD